MRNRLRLTGRPARSAAFAGALAAVCVVVAPSAAQAAAQAAADPQPQACPPDAGWQITGHYTNFVRDPAKTFTGQSGITLRVDVTKGETFSGTVTGSTSVEEGFIVAKAQETISASISKSKTATIAMGGSWTVPANQAWGWLAFGSRGWHVDWEYGSYNGNCVYRRIKGGSAELPDNTPTIAHS